MNCCYNHNIDKLEEIAYLLKCSMRAMGDTFLVNSKFGYPSNFKIQEFQKHKYYHIVLTKHIKSVYDEATPCFTCKTLQCFLEKCQDLVFNCCDIINNDLACDKSKKDKWNLENPYCIAREKWEELLYYVTGDITFSENTKSVLRSISVDSVFEEKKFNITFGIAYSQVLCAITSQASSYEHLCEIIANKKLYTKFCKIQSITKETLNNCLILYNEITDTNLCKISFDKLVKNPLCNLDFEVYLKLINCGLTTSFIEYVYTCGIQLDYNSKENCPIVINGEDQKSYNIDMTELLDFNLNNLPDVVKAGNEVCFKGIKYLDDLF